jgi:LysR family transcriptional regulator, glycine cleavage system transcriptional activator
MNCAFPRMRPGVAIGDKARAALSLLRDVTEAPDPPAITIGTRWEVGMSWLWPSLAALRKRRPAHRFDCHFGSGEEILRLLTSGDLDVILTSAPHAVRGFGVVEVAREDYVMVAAPRLARSVRSIEDLREHVLIEHDRSFPFLRYVDPATRSAIVCRDVWFVGSTRTMTSALLQGFGVGILPRYLARTPLATGRLKRILPGVRLQTDRCRLVYRLDRDVTRAVETVRGALDRHGLRA